MFCKYFSLEYTLPYKFIYFAVLEIKPRALHMLGKHSTTESHPQPTFLFFDDLSHRAKLKYFDSSNQIIKFLLHGLFLCSF
jgi:hypothetical protein